MPPTTSPVPLPAGLPLLLAGLGGLIMVRRKR
ncbi:MAG: VPLPA-CTERM sorting domain-containing protein [Arenibacterium sp.]